MNWVPNLPKFLDRHVWPRVQTQIRLLLEDHSDQGLHCLSSHLHFVSMHFTMVKPLSSHLRMITAIFSGVWLFRSFTENILIDWAEVLPRPSTLNTAVMLSLLSWNRWRKAERGEVEKETTAEFSVPFNNISVKSGQKMISQCHEMASTFVKCPAHQDFFNLVFTACQDYFSHSEQYQSSRSGKMGKSLRATTWDFHKQTVALSLKPQMQP